MPEHYAADCQRMMGLKEGFTIIKQSIAFHSPMRREIPNFYLGAPLETPFHGWHDSGLLTESRNAACNRLRRRDEARHR
jgi:hypothetical protein